MSELLGLAYYTEIPAVIIDVQRAGPSTGMPTRTQQGDLLACAYASHGDTKHLLLFPANPAECFDFAVKAFDLAEHFQTPVIMLSRPRHRHERLGGSDASRGTTPSSQTADVSSALPTSTRCRRFYRYADEDGDFVTPRDAARC